MGGLSSVVWGIYVIGVAVGLLRGDASLSVRTGLALVWPLGPLAFVLTVAVLLCVAALAFPAFGVIFAGAVALAWWLAW